MLCFLCLYLSASRRDFAAGVALAAAVGLKPQLGLWMLLFYAVSRRFKLTVAAVLGIVGLIIVAAVPLIGSVAVLASHYRENIQYHFGPGGLVDFATSDPVRFQVIDGHVILWQILQDRASTNLAVLLIFSTGLGLLGWIVLRNRVRHEALTVATLWGLTLTAIYHSVSDVTVVLLGLSWALGPNCGQRISRTLMLVAIGLLSLPIPSLLMRVQSKVRPEILESSLWNLIIGPAFIWLVVFFNIVSLVAVVAASRPARRATSVLCPQGSSAKCV
jgi:hypothetical protein